MGIHLKRARSEYERRALWRAFLWGMVIGAQVALAVVAVGFYYF